MNAQSPDNQLAIEVGDEFVPEKDRDLVPPEIGDEFTLAPTKRKESITVRGTGRYYSSVSEGNCQYLTVVSCNMSRKTGMLVYDIRGPTPPPNANMDLCASMGKAIREVRAAHPAPQVLNVLDMPEIDDEIITLLRGRGVEVIFEHTSESDEEPCFAVLADAALNFTRPTVE